MSQVRDIFASRPYFVCRVCLEYGGSDITRCYYELLVKAGFPYKECDLSKRMDAVFLKELKESHCHLDQVMTASMLVANYTLYVLFIVMTK